MLVEKNGGAATTVAEDLNGLLEKLVARVEGLSDLVLWVAAVLADEEEGDRVLDDRCRAAFRGAQGEPAGVLALDALVFGEFLEAYCAAAADLLGAESCERGMLLGLDLLCDLSMKL